MFYFRQNNDKTDGKRLTINLLTNNNLLTLSLIACINFFNLTFLFPGIDGKLLRCCTARGSSAKFSRAGPTKV